MGRFFDKELHCLPVDLHAELNLAGISACRINRTRATDRRSVLVEQSAVVEWRLEVGVIENIEELCTELHVEALRNPLDVVILEYGKVQVDDTGTVDFVTSRITQEIHTGVGY